MYKALNEADSGLSLDKMYDMAKGTIKVASGLARGSNASD